MVLGGGGEQKECPPLTGAEGLAGSALGCPVPPPSLQPVLLQQTFPRAYVDTALGDQGCGRRRGNGLGAPRGGRRQEIKPAGGREVMEDFLEVQAPKLGLKGWRGAPRVKGGG